MREKLPDKRLCETQRIKVNGQTVHFTVGKYPDGRPGELFIDMNKVGTSVRAWCESTSKLVSLMLQYGVPLSELVDALVGHCSEPFGRVPVTGHPVIVDASGVLDAVIRSMALDYLAESGKERPVAFSCIASATEHLTAAEIYDVVDDPEALDAFLEKFE